MRGAIALVVVAVVAVLGGCAADDDASPRPGATAGAGAVTVASFDFPESELLAEVYALALEDEGVVVDRQLRLGPRELVVPALRQGFVDVVPEYAGSALEAVDPGTPADRSDAGAVLAALQAALSPWGVAVLQPAPAANDNRFVVTTTLATRLGAASIGDLSAANGALRLGGPRECPARRQCLAGLEEVYGLRFRGFVALDGADLVAQALAEGVVDVGVLFATDPAIADDGVVALVDDRHLQPAENVVPVVRSAVLDGTVRRALDEVSAELTTEALRFLNWRLANAGGDPRSEARAWLVRHGLIER